MNLRFRLAAAVISLAATLLPVKVSAAAEGISAQAYVLIEAGSGQILQAKKEHDPLPIASTTKIMTALLALEQPAVDEYFTVDSTAIRVEGTSMGLREGDQASLHCLAAGMLLSSGNDAANAAAVRIAGSQAAFAEKMNARAAELGMTNSHFVTPSGLHDEAHYSSAADMALLARTALQNKQFAALCSSQRMKLTFGNPPFDRWLKNHNRLLAEYEGCIGVKTGFTKKAGRCLVSAASRNGVTLICVTLNAPNDWRDHTRLLDYGFSTVSAHPLSPDLSGITLAVAGSEKNEVALDCPLTLPSCLTPEQEAELERELILPPFLYAPVAKGEVVGELRLHYRGGLLGSLPLTAAEAAEYAEVPPKQSILDQIGDFFKSHFRL